MSNDDRTELYHDLHGRQLTQEESQNRYSARTILKLLRGYVDFKSMLDAGCGLGTWLAVAQEMGVSEIAGVDGPWLDAAKLVVDVSCVSTADFEKGFDVMGRKFDLAICLEVAEHLSPMGGRNLVWSLTEHSQVILFSAAIPAQGGHHHVNEQFLDYWIELFAGYHFVPVDAVRGEIWNDTSVRWWLRQNAVLFVHRDVLSANAALAAQAGVRRPLSIVHPEIYKMRLYDLSVVQAEHRAMIRLLGQGGTFQAETTPDGKINVKRL